MEDKRQQRGWMVNFFTIWGGQALSLVGSRMVQFALVWWLTESTGSATVLATATLAALIPEIVLGPIAGTYVDRWNRRVVMIVADGLIALASLWLAYVFWMGQAEIWHIYVIMFVRAVGQGFHYPAMHASTSLMVPKRHLSRVAGLNQALNGVLTVFGPPLGALLMALLPVYGVMLVDVGTALLAIGPLFFAHVPQPHRSAEERARKSSVGKDFLAGLRYILGWPGLVVLVGAAMIIKIALTPAFSLLPLLVSEHFGGDAAELGVLEAFAGVGILLGGLLLSVWGGFRRRIYTVLAGVAVLGVTFVVLSLLPATMFWVALGVMLVAGVMVSLVDGPIMAILQGTVAPEMQGRVLTWMGSLLWSTSLLSLAIAGPVTDRLGIQVWYALAGVLSVVAGGAGFFVPALVNIEANCEGGRALSPLDPSPSTVESWSGGK